MEILKYVCLIIGYLTTIVFFIISKNKSKENKSLINEKEEKAQQEELYNELKKKIIPLMEQAESLIDGTEKEDWVIKKLGNTLHIDFYKYKDILIMVKNIIKEVCELTKTKINKVIIKNEKEEVKKENNEMY